MNLTWTLYGSGERHADDWPEVHRHTHDWTAAWADITGFHIGPVPTESPVTTHLWAWTTGAWLRVRVDGHHWWAAILTTGDHDLSWTPRTLVSYPAITRILNWDPHDQRIRYDEDLSATFPNRVAFQLTPHQRTPVMFIGNEESLPQEIRTEALQ